MKKETLILLSLLAVLGCSQNKNLYAQNTPPKFITEQRIVSIKGDSLNPEKRFTLYLLGLSIWEPEFVGFENRWIYNDLLKDSFFFNQGSYRADMIFLPLSNWSSYSNVYFYLEKAFGNHISESVAVSSIVNAYLGYRHESDWTKFL